jgi:glutathione S-transferase
MGLQGDVAAARHALEQFRPLAGILDAHLEGRAFVTGGVVTLADYSLAAQLPLAGLGRVDLSPYPRIRAWLARLDEREAWRSAATPPAMVEALRRATAAPAVG